MKRLKVELVIAEEMGVHFDNATYNLEGVGALILKAYQILQSVSHSESIPRWCYFAPRLTHQSINSTQYMFAFMFVPFIVL